MAERVVAYAEECIECWCCGKEVAARVLILQDGPRCYSYTCRACDVKYETSGRQLREFTDPDYMKLYKFVDFATAYAPTP